jgi:TPR repeat protein
VLAVLASLFAISLIAGIVWIVFTAAVDGARSTSSTYNTDGSWRHETSTKPTHTESYTTSLDTETAEEKSNRVWQAEQEQARIKARQELAAEAERLRVKAQKERVFQFIKDKADKGEAYYQFRVGESYLNGEGVEQSDNEAERWLYRALGNGYLEATNVIAKLKSRERKL